MIVWLVVFLLVAIPTVWVLIQYVSQPADQRVPAAGGDVTITEPGQYAIYAESTQGSPGNWPGITSVTAPSGTPATVVGPDIEENYNYNTRVATRVATLTATEPGTYRVVGDDRGTVPGDELVVSSRTVGAIFLVIASSVLTGIVLVVGLVGGLVLLVTGRRGPPPPPPGYPSAPGPHGPPPAGTYAPPPAPAVVPQPPPSEDPTVTVRRDDRT